MRRSAAPSVRKSKEEEKRKCIEDLFEQKIDNKVSASVTRNEATKATPNEEAKGSRQHGKTIYNIMWREISKRKHKIWKGDGTLEIDLESRRAVLKDDTGKYFGSVTISKNQVLDEGTQLIVGGKEIELQSKIQNEREYWLLRKQQVANRGWGEDECQPEEKEEKKPKGAFIFRPNLILSMPNMPKTNIEDRILKRTIIREKGGVSPEKKLRKEKENFHIDLSTKNMAEIQKSDDLVKDNIQVAKTFRQLSYSRRSNTHGTEDFVLIAPADLLDCPLVDVPVSPTLSQHLRPHQQKGVSFLYSCLMGFQQSDYYGCILADDMGLGKTLQCLTIAHTLLQRGPFGGQRVLQRVLIVTPSSLTVNWNNEVNKWLKTERMFAFIVDGKHKLSSYSQQQHIPFVIVSYETLLAHAEEFQQLQFDLLICDEGHRLKNQSTKIYRVLCELSIKRRVILTGTPVQNDLQEFFALADFVNPGIFGSAKYFHTYFELPIQQGQCPSATEETKAMASERAAELNELSSKFLLRRLQEVNRQYLPLKREYICFIRPSDLQLLLLQKALDLYRLRKDSILQELNPLQIITVLKKICNHPTLIGRTKKPNLLTRNLERHLPEWSEMGPFDSAKLELVQNFLIETVIDRREKCVLVSNHTKTLNMLQGLCDYLNIKCLRLDGATSTAERNANVEKFNETPSDTINGDDAYVFLLSAKAGGVGLNLIGASRLILFDNDWNPATDAQAMSRIWRDGQQKNVQIYRLISAGCIEEKIFQRQVAKITLGDCVVPTNLTSGETMKFSVEDLLDLFTLQEDYSSCQTHQSLNCRCAGDGMNVNDKTTLSKQNKQINELMQWEHHKPPFDRTFLEEACLHNSSENLTFIFSNQTQLI